MDIKAQLSKWVEKKIGRIIDEDLKVKIDNEYSQFNVQAYVKCLENKYFTAAEIEDLRKSLNCNFSSIVNDFDLYDTDEEENESKDLLEFYNNEFSTFSLDETVKNLENDSVDIKKQSLKALEVYAEELVNHKSWAVAQKSILKVLKDRDDPEMHMLVLKIFLKILSCVNKPPIVCKGFTSIAKILASFIKIDVSYEEIYDFREGRWFHKESPLVSARNEYFQKPQKLLDLEIPVKLMWLLIHSQQEMPEKWIRFNEKILREIIFSFVHLLYSTNSEEGKNLTALGLLSILNPTATWCRYWCHTAMGRNVLCSALRKYKKFFIHLIEIILKKVKTKKIRQLQTVRSNEIIKKNYSKEEIKVPSFPKIQAKRERSKCVRSAPVDLAENDSVFIFWKLRKNSKWEIESIPKKVVTEAIFWHSVSVVACLIQFRCGQALFPVQTAVRKRSLSIQDLSLILTEYLENLEYNEITNQEFSFNTAYKADVQKKIELLKTIRNNILSSKMKIEKSPTPNQ